MRVSSACCTAGAFTLCRLSILPNSAYARAIVDFPHLIPIGDKKVLSTSHHLRSIRQEALPNMENLAESNKGFPDYRYHSDSSTDKLKNFLEDELQDSSQRRLRPAKSTKKKATKKGTLPKETSLDDPAIDSLSREDSSEIKSNKKGGKSCKKGKCSKSDDVMSILTALLSFETADDAMKDMESDDMDMVVSAVRDLVVNEDAKELVTEEAIATVIYEDPGYIAKLFPVRRHLAFFDYWPDGCSEATHDLATSALAVILNYIGVNQSGVIAKAVIQDLVALDSSNPMIAKLFETYSPTWFVGTPEDALKGGMVIFGHIVSFFGLKTVHNAMMNRITNQQDSLLLALIAIAVTNGSNLFGQIQLSLIMDGLALDGTKWMDSCFEPNNACEGEAVCDDGNFCTIDRAFCNERTNWEWKCFSSPVSCPPGYSCNPSDGTCQPDDILVPCVAVIDEDDNFSDQTAKWNEFRDKYPARPFCLLVPKPIGDVRVPEAFLSDDLTVIHYDVARDNGNQENVMDWVSMCGLDHYTSSNVEWVGLFIDDSGSMKEYQVAASRDLFQQKIQQQGMQIKKVVNPNENWILPFLTTLAPQEGGVEEQESEDTPCEQVDGYVFWRSYDSELFDITQTEASNLQRLAESCDEDASCKGFNTNGYMKNYIQPLDRWKSISSDSSDCQGLYIKSPKVFIVNGKVLTEEESRWMIWIATWTIPNMETSIYDAVINTARGAWWTLREGVLNIASWNPLVRNPFHHSLCAYGESRQEQIGLFEVCPTNIWQVGIAAEQPKEYSLSQLEDYASSMYGSVEKALSQTAKQLELTEASEEYNEVIASNGDLRRAWLIRNHLVAFSLVNDKIRKRCEDPTKTESWCWGTYGGSCPSCGTYAPSAASVPVVIDDVRVLLQSLVGSSETVIAQPPLPVPSAIGETIMDIARKELSLGIWEDVREDVDSGGHIAKYMTAATYGGVDPTRHEEPWCACFVSWVYQKAGIPLGAPKWPGRGFRYVPYMISDLDSIGMYHKIGSGYKPVPGDIVLMNNHVGLLESVNSDGTYTTIEGNTKDPTGTFREGVYRKTRYPDGGYVYGIAHVFGTSSPIIQPEDEPDDVEPNDESIALLSEHLIAIESEGLQCAGYMDDLKTFIESKVLGPLYKMCKAVNKLVAMQKITHKIVKNSSKLLELAQLIPKYGKIAKPIIKLIKRLDKVFCRLIDRLAGYKDIVFGTTTPGINSACGILAKVPKNNIECVKGATGPVFILHKIVDSLEVASNATKQSSEYAKTSGEVLDAAKTCVDKTTTPVDNTALEKVASGAVTVAETVKEAVEVCTSTIEEIKEFLGMFDFMMILSSIVDEILEELEPIAAIFDKTLDFISSAVLDVACCGIPTSSQSLLRKIGEVIDLATCWAGPLSNAIERFLVDLLPDIDIKFEDITLVNIEVPHVELQVFEFDPDICELTIFDITNTPLQIPITIPGLEFDLKEDILNEPNDIDGQTLGEEIKEECKDDLLALTEDFYGDCCCMAKDIMVETGEPCVLYVDYPWEIGIHELTTWLSDLPRCGCCRDGDYVTDGCAGIPLKAMTGICGTTLPVKEAGDACGLSGVDCLCGEELRCARRTSLSSNDYICCDDVEGEPLSGYEFCRGNILENQPCPSMNNDDCKGDLKCARRTSLSSNDYICCDDVEEEPLSLYEFCKGNILENQPCPSTNNDDCEGDLYCARRSQSAEETDYICCKDKDTNLWPVWDVYEYCV